MNSKMITISDCYIAHMDELFPIELQNLLLKLHQEFEPRRISLLASRKVRQEQFDNGDIPRFDTSHPAKNSAWKVGTIPKDLLDRRVEITGPISNTKMVINMLNANSNGDRAQMAMLDFEDSMNPTWINVTNGLKNIISVAHKNLTYYQIEESGKEIGKEKLYQLDKSNIAHPMVRVRGLHLNEKNVCVGGEYISAGLFDFVCTAFHTSKIFINHKMTPKFYIPKTEHYLEARWWNKLFSRVEEELAIEKGKIKVTLLIETLPAAFMMEEILYEIKEHAVGLNGGRWDKIFSDIKTLKMHSDRVLADRSSIDMSRTWMDNYAKLLIKTCHKHGAFAMGGMSAFTPGNNEVLRNSQTEKVISDKSREASIGHDGCWVSHPYFISSAKAQFNRVNQLDVLLEDFSDTPDLLPKSDGPKTIDGLRQNIRVGIAYQKGWNEGNGCVAFENLMEDLATLEISRAQVWQWLHHKIILDDGTQVSKKLIENVFEEECLHILKNHKIENDSLEMSKYFEARDQAKLAFLQNGLTDFFSNIY